MLTDSQISELRSHFPILRDTAYLYSNSQGALSDWVEEGMREYMDVWRTSPDPWSAWMEAYEGLRTAFASFIGADRDEVAIVTSASAGINPIANALQFLSRSKVVMSEYEFPTMAQIWLAQRSRGAQVQFIEGETEVVPAESYQRAIDEKTLVVPLTHVSFLNGFRPDVAAITSIAHANGALVFLDGYQDCGTRRLDVKALGVDFYVTGTLKYLLGPPGVAFLYVRRDLIESLTPTLTSWMAQQDPFAFDAKCFAPAANARRFEGGSPPIPNIYMARQALDLLTRIGLDNVSAQIERLTGLFLQGLRDLSVASKTPKSSVGPLVVVRAKDAQVLLAKLSSRKIAASARRDGVRFAFHVYNTFEDVRQVLAALDENFDLLVRS
jgi:selenocysteine lyase/cysteine desulfurase